MATALTVNGSQGWRDCAAWLTRCGAIRPDHKANWPDSSVADLAYTLRDGVVLCSLLNVVDPGCIDMKDVNQKPQMAQFLCLRNIKTFLTICKEIFHLRETDLFKPSELFDLSDFLRVLQTLSTLSYSPRLQRTGIAGFSIRCQSSQSEDDIYRTLTSGDSQNQSELEAEYSSYDEYSQANEEIYQEIFSQRRSTDLPEWLNAALPQSLEKRDYVIKELVETEKNYLDVLTSVQKYFMKPLKSSFLREEEHAIIFAKIRELSEVHIGFHTQLRKAVNYGPQSGGRLGEVFLIWREHFLVYGDYCANLPHAQALLADLCHRNELFNQELIRCQEEANQGKFKLRDILSVPMQRILKYHLLLEKLLQETPQQHEDYRNLERAREAMVDVAQYINEVKRDSDTLQIIRDIQNSITDWNMPENMELKDYGRLLKDGELRIKAHDDSKNRIRYVFVFDQVMLMCKATRGEHYRFRDSLRLIEYKVEDLMARKTSYSDRFSWYLIHKSEKTAFTMCARTEDLKRKWMKALQEAIDNVDPPGCRNTDHRFIMHSFEKPQTCHHCSKYLKGRIFQGYLCEQCSLAVHKHCISLSGRCGGPRHRAPPALPPRPLPLPVEPEPVPPLSPRVSQIEDLSSYLWFAGEMSRDDAQNELLHKPDGTFLLRIRPQGPSSLGETIYALSLKIQNRVKHMKVCEDSCEDGEKFYLSKSQKFRSIEELVRYYEHKSLSKIFDGLDIALELPYRRIPATVIYDFEPTEINQLPLRRGMTLDITSKEGDHKGWWKGRANGRLAEHLTDSGSSVMYITKNMSHIPPALHGFNSKIEAFARIHFRYLQDRDQLYETLLDPLFFKKLSKAPHTVIIDGLENYCDTTRLDDVPQICATLLGTIPVPSTIDVPHLVVSLNYNPTTINKQTLQNFHLYFSLILDMQKDSEGTTNVKNGSKLIQFDVEEIKTQYREEQLLKLKSIITE